MNDLPTSRPEGSPAGRRPRIQNAWLGALAILCLTILEIQALRAGVNGALLSIVVAVIAGIAGYEVRILRGR